LLEFTGVFAFSDDVDVFAAFEPAFWRSSGIMHCTREEEPKRSNAPSCCLNRKMTAKTMVLHTAKPRDVR
jgi:hypothetical protein